MKQIKTPISKLQMKKTPSGIRGLDDITSGGLPEGRTTLVTGGPGCGKTLFGLEFLFCGALKYHEPGVFVSFEETPEELMQNFVSLKHDLPAVVKQKLLLFEHIHIDKSEIEETGEYDLDGLFIRLEHAIDSIGAKRIVLDTLETLFSGLSNALVIRAELRRLFRWLKMKGVTAILTGERGEKDISRYSLEDFVADCGIILDHRVQTQVSTRRLRIVKYRGSTHGTNEYPFLIDSMGMSVMPITSLELTHGAPTGRVSSGTADLDLMLEGQGFFKGSSILISGTAGTGKTTFASRFADAASRRGETSLFFAFEESPDQITRNMASTGTNLKEAIADGRLIVHAARPTFFGLEHHLVRMHELIVRHKPTIVVVDPMSNLISVGTPFEVKIMLTRLIDALKILEVTAVFTSLVPGRHDDSTEADFGVSSLMDSWIILRSEDREATMTRTLQIVKSRGMNHSSRVYAFDMTSDGIHFRNLMEKPNDETEKAFAEKIAKKGSKKISKKR